MWREPEEKALEIYLRQARERQSGIPSEEEERELAERAKGGDREALSRLVDAYLGYVFQVALQYRGRGVPLADLVEEGNLGLLEAIRRYDPSRGTRLLTYARWWIMNRITHALRTHHLIPLKPTDTRVQRVLRDLLARYDQEGKPAPTLEEIEESLTISRELLLANLLPIQMESLDDPTPRVEGRKLEEILEDLRYPTPENLVLREEIFSTLDQAVDSLTPRQREVIILYYGLRGSPTHTMEQIAQVMGISKQRVNILHKRALKNLASLLGGRFRKAFHEWEHDRP